MLPKELQTVFVQGSAKFGDPGSDFFLDARRCCARLMLTQATVDAAVSEMTVDGVTGVVSEPSSTRAKPFVAVDDDDALIALEVREHALLEGE